MSEAKHTPGPWAVFQANGAAPIYVQASPRKERRFDVALLADGDNPTLLANARLIAAVPDLYEALRAIEDHCSGKSGSKGVEHAAEGQRIRERARAAIAKAEGRAP